MSETLIGHHFPRRACNRLINLPLVNFYWPRVMSYVEPCYISFTFWSCWRQKLRGWVKTMLATKSCLPYTLLDLAMWECEWYHWGHWRCSSLRIVMGRSHQGTTWVCVLRENWQEQKREERDSNEWAIVREIEEHLYGLLCHWSCKMETYFSPDSYSRSNPLSWAAYDVVWRWGGLQGCPKGLLFLVRD